VAIAKYAVPRLLNDAGIILYHGEQWNLGWALMPLTQSLLEELVLRALLLNGMLFYFQRIKLISIFAAMIFMVWHLIFFHLAQGAWLSNVTLVTLFLFGYASNNFFLIYRNIAIPFALHAGWNIIKFGGEYLDKATSERISEAQVFNAVEGSWTVLTLALGLAAVSELVILRKPGDKLAGKLQDNH
ncbi:MAG: CPBP family intramembrane glutamic endopeptidase, partial [Legionellaceae bacterium]